MSRDGYLRARNTDRLGFSGAGFFSIVLLLGMATQSAHANSEYDGTSLNGNLQNQCTSFGAALDSGTSLTVSAECNKSDASGNVAATRQSTSFDLSGDVVWNSQTEAFVWDATPNASNAITLHCTAVRGFAYTTANVTLQLSCNKANGRQAVSSSTGAVISVDADLKLNGKLTAGTDGKLARR